MLPPFHKLLWNLSLCISSVFLKQWNMFLWFYYPYSKISEYLWWHLVQLPLGFTNTAVCIVHCLFHHLSNFVAVIFTVLQPSPALGRANFIELDWQYFCALNDCVRPGLMSPMFSMMFLQSVFVSQGGERVSFYSDNGQIHTMKSRARLRKYRKEK